MEGSDGRGVLDGAFRVLRALPDVVGEHQIAELARATGIPRSSVHRLVAQLQRVGAVRRDRGRWVLSTELLDITRRVEPVAGLRVAATGVMQALREQSGATVSLVVPTGPAFVALEMIPGREVLPFDSYAGFGMPAASAAALVLDPAASPRRVDARHGSAADDQDVIDGVTCYAVPVLLPGGDRAALQIATGPATPAQDLAVLVHRAARALTARAGRP